MCSINGRLAKVMLSNIGEPKPLDSDRTHPAPSSSISQGLKRRMSPVAIKTTIVLKAYNNHMTVT